MLYCYLSMYNVYYVNYSDITTKVYILQSERQLEGEMLLRGQLLQTMSDQQNLMDALTSVSR